MQTLVQSTGGVQAQQAHTVPAGMPSFDAVVCLMQDTRSNSTQEFSCGLVWCLRWEWT